MNSVTFLYFYVDLKTDGNNPTFKHAMKSLTECLIARYVLL